MSQSKGLPCSQCGRDIAEDEIVYRRLSGAFVCEECFLGEQAKRVTEMREARDA
jgi:predicted RNA-binding Zn-ribbon protein involved in translation (DUF1610 family)